MVNRGSNQYRAATVGSWATFEIPVSGGAADTVRSSGSLVEASSEPLSLPPLLAGYPALVQPLTTHPLGADEAEAFTLPAELARDVSPSTPVRVALTPPAGTLSDAYVVFALASDGRYTYLAGPPVVPSARPGSDLRGDVGVALEITRLPDLEEESPATPEATRLRFGIFRGVKLAFFKIVGKQSPELGLRVPSLDRSQVRYRPVAAGELAGKRVALLVHGFLSQTGWMVRSVLPDLLSAGYDAVVTWDYETFTTRLRRTSGDLAAALQAGGVAPGGQSVDVIAHSQGTLVTRGLITHDPALNIVRRAALLGAPNAGTPIAGVLDRFTALASTFLNVEVGPVSPGAVLRFLLERVDQGLDDLQPNSAFVQELSQRPDKQPVPLTLVAGNATGDPMEPLVGRILHKAAAHFYGGPNDLVVPVHSMTSVASPPYPNVVQHSVRCNHFEYLQTDRPARALVAKWINAQGG